MFVTGVASLVRRGETEVVATAQPALVSVGATSQASAVTRDVNNNVLTGRTITWSSTNDLIATVNATSGLVTAVAVGSASIVATSETKTGATSITVTAAPVASVAASLA